MRRHVGCIYGLQCNQGKCVGWDLWIVFCDTLWICGVSHTAFPLFEFDGSDVNIPRNHLSWWADSFLFYFFSMDTTYSDIPIRTDLRGSILHAHHNTFPVTHDHTACYLSPLTFHIYTSKQSNCHLSICKFYSTFAN